MAMLNNQMVFLFCDFSPLMSLVSSPDVSSSSASLGPGLPKHRRRTRRGLRWCRLRRRRRRPGAGSRDEAATCRPKKSLEKCDEATGILLISILFIIQDVIIMYLLILMILFMETDWGVYGGCLE